MRVIFFRHGIATDRDAKGGPPDADRPLTGKGEKRTRAAAAGLRALGVAPDLVLSSPYLRARQTATLALAAMALGEDHLQLDACLQPESPARTLLARLAEEDADEVLVVGHAPHLDHAIAHALGVGAPVTALRKAGAACVEVADLRRPKGQLVWLLGAKALRRLGASARRA